MSEYEELEIILRYYCGTEKEAEELKQHKEMVEKKVVEWNGEPGSPFRPLPEILSEKIVEVCLNKDTSADQRAHLADIGARLNNNQGNITVGNIFTILKERFKPTDESMYSLRALGGAYALDHFKEQREMKKSFFADVDVLGERLKSVIALQQGGVHFDNFSGEKQEQMYGLHRTIFDGYINDALENVTSLKKRAEMCNDEAEKEKIAKLCPVVFDENNKAFFKASFPIRDTLYLMSLNTEEKETENIADSWDNLDLNSFYINGKRASEVLQNGYKKQARADRNLEYDTFLKERITSLAQTGKVRVDYAYRTGSGGWDCVPVKMSRDIPTIDEKAYQARFGDKIEQKVLADAPKNYKINHPPKTEYRSLNELKTPHTFQSLLDKLGMGDKSKKSTSQNRNHGSHERSKEGRTR